MITDSIDSIDSIGTIEELTEQLRNILPHGSGIDGDWYIDYRAGKFYATNCFEAMNEVGMYCHDYDFTAVYALRPTAEPCPYCDSGVRRFDGQKCIRCNSTGTIHHHSQFELSRLTIHGRTFVCCGYDLKEYLEEILSL